MPQKLKLVRESKLCALLKGEDKDSRLEASGVYALDSSTCFIAFDNRTQVALIDLSLKKAKTNKLVTVLSPTEGFESIAASQSPSGGNTPVPSISTGPVPSVSMPQFAISQWWAPQSVSWPPE